MAARGLGRGAASRSAAHTVWLHVRIYGPAVLLTVGGFFVAYQFVDPAPPRRVVIATGGTGGAYYAFAQRYRATFAREGIELEVRVTGGSVENLALLRDPDSGVDVAFVQGGIGRGGEPGTGTSREARGEPGGGEPRTGNGREAASSPGVHAQREDAGLHSLGSMYFEPLWVFHRASVAPERLSDLRGRVIALGAPGSGTRAIALELLAANGVTEQNATFVPLAGHEAADALAAGRVDVAFQVAAMASGVVRDLMQSSGVSILSFERAEAYARNYRYLSRVVLPRGAVDLAADLPSADIELLAPAATLVATARLHPAIVDLLLQAATDVHGRGGLFERYGQFPSPEYVDFPLGDDARRYFRSGPKLLQRYLPFWAATFVDRSLVMLLPVVALMLPLMRVMPPMYRWRMRARVYRWYKELLAVEPSPRAQVDGVAERLEALRRIEEEVSKVSVPMSFADQLYQLRVHIELVRERLLGAGAEAEAGESRASGDPVSRDPR